MQSENLQSRPHVVRKVKEAAHYDMTENHKDILLFDSIEFQDMTPHRLDVLLERSHLLLVTQHADNIVSSHYAQLRKERPNHLQMIIADTIEHNGIYIL